MVQGTNKLDVMMPKPAVTSKSTAASKPIASSSFADRLEKATAAPVNDKVEESSSVQTGSKQEQMDSILDEILQTIKEDGLPAKLEDNPALQTLIQQLYALMNAQLPQKESALQQPAEGNGVQSILPNASPEEWMKKMYDMLVSMQKAAEVNPIKGMSQGLQAKFEQVLTMLKGANIPTVATNSVKLEASAEQAKGIQEMAVVLPMKPQTATEQGALSQQQSGKDQEKSGTSMPTVATAEEIETVVPGEGDAVKAMHHQLSDVTPIGSKEVASAGKAHIPLVPSRFFVNEMETLVLKQVQLNRGTGAMETVIRLFPENLGQVDVRISALNGNIMAQFITANAAGKEAVEQHLNQLRQALMQHGLHVEKLEVTQLQTSAGNSSTNQDTLNGQGKEQSSQREQQQASKEEEEKPAFNLEDLLNEEGIAEETEVL
ncbi:flagellar hook-length control protein FliK [Aneurinibacillus soli]|uniref:Flagellar hook-length control protein FliK n=1 Tax=Aneurinibacillus soli TaxID=1500254 RepID=A0A0U4WG18_9BACL|nr:flagellar hook-length control protein FliK [Aneurinibacillus soli]PYE63396.1 flagellar hook-length control protein FliK [Aneurinibacillus soli]BAU27672.1 Flagellar hook-length control protein FliK [Aneurinibacillus soli]